jgi:lysophospholipase L1-like esterase
MTRTLFLTLALATSLQAESPKAPQPAAATAPTTPLPENLATHPLPRDEKWMEKHLAFNATSKEGKAELVFLGDSITQGWLGRGKASWDKHWAPLGAANFGIGGDRTEHVLWRLQNGNFDGLKPKLIVMMIGTNNTGHVGKTWPELHGAIYHSSPEHTASGVKAILDTLQSKMPETKILLLGIFPRGEQSTDPMRQTNLATNALIQKLADGQKILFKDIGSTFLSPEGTATREIMYDFLHLTDKGYELYASAIEADVKALLGK